MRHLWSAKPRIYYGFLGIFLGAVLLAWDPMRWPVLHTLWGVRLLWGTAVVSAFGMMHFKTGTPTCFALEAYPLRQEEGFIPANRSLTQSRERSAGPMSEWSVVKWSGIGVLISWAVQAVTWRHDPPFPRVDEAMPDATAWPEWSRYVVSRLSGRLAHWDPWRTRMVVGQAWDETGWLGLHVLAHELAHAAQPRWRLRLADGWIKGLLLVSVAAGLFGPAGWGAPLLAAGALGLGDAGWRWPLEAQADDQAGERLASEISDATTRAAVRHWGQRIRRRHRAALAAETVFWAAGAAVLVALTQALVSRW